MGGLSNVEAQVREACARMWRIYYFHEKLSSKTASLFLNIKHQMMGVDMKFLQVQFKTIFKSKK